MVGWIRIRFGRLAWLVEAAPHHLRWRWDGNVLVSPHGTRWEYRLARGVWLRREIAAKKGTPNNPTVTQTKFGLTQR